MRQIKSELKNKKLFLNSNTNQKKKKNHKHKQALYKSQFMITSVEKDYIQTMKSDKEAINILKPVITINVCL